MVNRLTATGVIVGTRSYKNGSGTITVAVKTAFRIIKNSQGENAVRDDYLVFNYNSQSKPDDIATRFKKGDHVQITGHTASFIRANEKNAGTEIINFYIDTIEPTTTEFEKTFGVAGGHYPADAVALCAEGVIVGITTLNNAAVLMRLNLSDNKRKNYINVLAYDKYAEMAKQCKIGDSVCFSAQIKTLDEDVRNGRDFNQFRLTGLARFDEPIVTSTNTEKKKSGAGDSRKTQTAATAGEDRAVDPAASF